VGYTHYWELTKISKHSTRHTAVIRDMVKIVKNSPVPLAGGDGTGKPGVSKTEIVFNGKAPDEDHETFWFPGEDGFNFCKTARKPYDIVVVACLAAAKDVYGSEIKVSSDGDAAEWADGVALASRVLGRNIPGP
jgi:hypothetical protein